MNCELQEFFRLIRLKIFFASRPNLSERNTGLRKPSTFSPPHNELPQELLTFERSVIHDLASIPVPSTFQNLSNAERTALKTLADDTTIVIKPADKGGGIVLLPQMIYRNECLRLLGDTTNYTPISADPTDRLLNQIKSLVFEAETHGWILPTEAAFLINDRPTTPYFYVLPKIHKGISPPPGRPIVSGINSVLEPLSKFTDSFLHPLVQTTPTYLKDTKDILNLITEINNLYTVDVLLTLDVEALYTSIPQQTTLEVIQMAMHNSNWSSRTPIHFIMDCATLALTENFFKFENQLYLQIKGTSMGSTFAPSLACLYMCNFEEQFILHESNPFKNEIRLWKRFIDDILVIWHGEVNKAEEFHAWLNMLDPFLHFTKPLYLLPRIIFP